MKRRSLIAYMPFGAIALMDIARAAPKNVANLSCQPNLPTSTPYFLATELVAALLHNQVIPAAQAFAKNANELAASLAIPGAPWVLHRQAWLNCMLAWERLAAFPIGELVERRSMRTLDFWPTRPAQIQALLDGGLGALQNSDPLQTVGVSARGLPALEWLLYRKSGQPMEVRLTQLLAAQVQAEADTLALAYAQLAARSWDEADAWSAYGEWFSQALGSLEQLRLKKLKANTRGKDTSLWIRGLSGRTTAAWQAHALGVQTFLTGTSDGSEVCLAPYTPPTGSFASLLLARRHGVQASQLLAHTRLAVASIKSATPARPASLRNAQTALASLHTFASDLGSNLFDFSQGFTDADGD